MTIFVTGGASYLGADFVLNWLAGCHSIVNLGKLPFFGNPKKPDCLQVNPCHMQSIPLGVHIFTQ